MKIHGPQVSRICHQLKFLQVILPFNIFLKTGCNFAKHYLKDKRTHTCSPTFSHLLAFMVYVDVFYPSVILKQHIEV